MFLLVLALRILCVVEGKGRRRGHGNQKEKESESVERVERKREGGGGKRQCKTCISKERGEIDKNMKRSKRIELHGYGKELEVKLFLASSGCKMNEIIS